MGVAMPYPRKESALMGNKRKKKPSPCEARLSWEGVQERPGPSCVREETGPVYRL